MKTMQTHSPTSSRLKRTPPIGAPKATDTPTAAAADKISRFLASFLPYLGNKYDNILPVGILDEGEMEILIEEYI